MATDGDGATRSRLAEGGGGGPGGPPIRGGHDWHTEAYVRRWVEENEARAEGRRPQLDLLADSVPFPEDAALRILDVGAGWGPVTRHLLDRFPAAQATLLDYSEEMFAEARPRLAAFGERVRYVLGDLSRPGAGAAALKAAGAPFDAVVSSSCLHNVRPTERIPALYRELRAVTAPGGCFLNLDLVGTTAPLLQPAWHRARVEQLRRRRLAETGRRPSFEEAEAELLARRERHLGAGAPPSGGPAGGAPQPPSAPGQPTFATSGGASRSLLDHLAWLREAGFDAVECFWRQDSRALIGGYVQPEAGGPAGGEGHAHPSLRRGRA